MYTCVRVGRSLKLRSTNCVSKFTLYNIIKILNINFTLIYKSCVYVKYNYKINTFKSIPFK